MPTPLWFSQLHASGQRRLTVRPPLFAKHCVTPPSTTRQLIYRLAIPGGMLCLFAALAALWVFGFQPEYFGALRLLGIEPYRFPFLDIHGVLAAAECHWQGIDVYLSNPCDVENRIQTYSPLWLVLIPRSWGAAETTRAGVILVLVFISSLPVVLRPRSGGETLIFALAAFSPMTVFALERANNDLILFLLILCAAALYLAPRPYRLCSYAVFLIAGLLKYYPLVLLALMARERWRAVLFPAILAAAALVLFALYYRADLGYMLTNLPWAPYFTNAFSAKNLPYGFAGAMPDNPFISRSAVALVLLCALLANAAGRIRGNIRLLATTAIGWAEPEATWLVIGSLLLTACFFTGPNMDYRGIFFLFVLPGLVRLHQSADCAPVRRWLSWMIAATLFVMWKEALRRGLYRLLDYLPNEWLRQLSEFLFWLGRELVWWWLIAGLASILVMHFWRMPLTKESVAGFRRLAASSSSRL